MHKQSDIQSVHYARIKHDALRTLLYAELLKDRTNGRWENKPELASKYVEDRKNTERVYRDKLKAIGVNVPDDQSFLYSTIPGREEFNPGKGHHPHNFNINDEDLKRTLFDVVGLPDKLLHPDGPQLGQAGYDDAIARWDKHKKILGKSKYMGMTIKPRIEVISPHGNTGYANLMKQSEARAKPKAHIHTHTRSGGQVINVCKLWDIVKDQKSAPVSLSSLDINKSKRSGFRQTRLQRTNPKYPIMLGPAGEIVDGRHRAVKLLNAGKTSIKAYQLSEADMRKAVIDRALSNKFRAIVNKTHFDMADGGELQKFISTLTPKQKDQLHSSTLPVKKANISAGDPGMLIKYIQDVKNRKYLYHGSGQKLDNLDPKFNSKKHYGYEYGVPVVFATDKPSSAFTATPTPEYLALKNKINDSIYHRLIDPATGRKLLLGHNPTGYMHVLPASSFKYITREDKELGQYITSNEYVSEQPVKPLRSYKMRKRDVDAIPEYEFLGEDNVGEMNVQDYLTKAKDPKVILAIQNWLNKRSSINMHKQSNIMNKEAMLSEFYKRAGEILNKSLIDAVAAVKPENSEAVLKRLAQIKEPFMTPTIPQVVNPLGSRAALIAKSPQWENNAQPQFAADMTKLQAKPVAGIAEILNGLLNPKTLNKEWTNIAVRQPINVGFSNAVMRALSPTPGAVASQK